MAMALEDVLLCHGTPERDGEYLLEDVSRSGLSLASPERIRSKVSSTAPAILCAHSHIPRFVQLDEGTVVMNPGSIGLQAYYDAEHEFPHAMETGSPHARYALLEKGNHGWQATFRAVVYDWGAAARRAFEKARPDWAHALATGYALRP